MLALLRAELGVRLARSFPTIRLCHSWQELEACFRLSARPVLFLDPSAAVGLHDRIARFTAAAPAAVVVLYTRSDPGSFQASLPFVRAGIADVVIAGVDDSPARLGQLIRDIEARQPASPLIAALQPELARLPTAVAEAVAFMFRHPARILSVDDLARRASVSRRSLFRYLKRSGIRSARLLVAASRVAAAHQLLGDRTRTIAAVASMLGYTSPDQLRDHFVVLTGVGPGAAREKLSAGRLDTAILSTLRGTR